MKNLIFGIPGPTLVRVKMKYDWRKEYEPEFIALTLQRIYKDYIHLDYPMNPKDKTVFALSLGLYNTYEYTLYPVTEKEAEYWIKAHMKFNSKIVAGIPFDMNKLGRYTGKIYEFKPETK